MKDNLSRNMGGKIFLSLNKLNTLTNVAKQNCTMSRLRYFDSYYPRFLIFPIKHFPIYFRSLKAGKLNGTNFTRFSCHFYTRPRSNYSPFFFNPQPSPPLFFAPWTLVRLANNRQYISDKHF